MVATGCIPGPPSASLANIATTMLLVNFGEVEVGEDVWRITLTSTMVTYLVPYPRTAASGAGGWWSPGQGANGDLRHADPLIFSPRRIRADVCVIGLMDAD